MIDVEQIVKEFKLRLEEEIDWKSDGSADIKSAVLQIGAGLIRAAYDNGVEKAYDDIASEDEG